MSEQKSSAQPVRSPRQPDSKSPVAQPAVDVTTSQKWWILLAVGIASFMAALDGSVVNIILPVVRDAFHSDVATMEWVVTIYLLVMSGLLLSVGRLGDLRGHKIVYVAGFVVFVIGSALCGLAPTARLLIGFRALQALGAAMLAANSPAILTQHFPAEERGRALGLQATMTYLALALGPSLGGWLTEQLSWRAVFYMNVPVGIAALWLSTHFIPPDHAAEQTEPFDLAGAATFLFGLSALLLGLNQGYLWGWTSPSILALLTIAIVLLGLFIWLEQRVRSPMLDLTLFHRRLFSAATASAVFNYICVSSVLFLLPFYLIQGRGFDPAYAGLLLTAQPIIMAVAAPLSGALSDRIGSRLLSTFGMAVLALGLFLLSRIGPQSSPLQIIVDLVLIGLGTGVFISPNTSALLGAAPRGKQGIASGVLATARSAGQVLGVALAGAIFTTVEISAQSSGAANALYQGIAAGLLVAAGVGVLGVLTSAVRGT